MTTPTQKPIPSNAPQDLLFNAEKIDEVVSSAAKQYTDRFGAQRLTLAGVRQAADAVLAGLGYAVPVAFASGLSMTLPTQTVSYGGEVYAPVSSALPFTTTGTFNPAQWRVIQGITWFDLAQSNAAGKVGYGSKTVAGALDEIYSAPNPLEVLSHYDGANMIGHLGGTVESSLAAVDDKFLAVDGKFAALDIVPAVSRKHAFGGQLRKLRDTLGDPLQQIVGICLIGDSITWGLTLPDNAAYDPRNGTLADPRDNFTSSSWANLLKRYIGRNYANNAAPVLGNWSTSSAGKAIAEYSTKNLIFPSGAPFSLTQTGSSLSVSEIQNASSPTGYHLQLADGNVAATSYHSLKFQFTGKEFTLIYGIDDSAYCDYEVFVNGVSTGVYTTSSSGGGVNNTYNNRRTHSFGHVRNKEIEIRSKRTVMTGNRYLKISGIEVNKIIRVTNQGIIGTDAFRYLAYNLSGDFGPGAITGEDLFVFVQIGTNDRLIQAALPGGIQGFRRSYQKLLDKISPLADPILMVSNPAENENPSTYSFTMQGARAVILGEAKLRAFDFIDNYAIFDQASFPSFTADGLHPNALGHRRIAQNIIAAMEQA
jgi:lysophospholipase L1-like esterase